MQKLITFFLILFFFTVSYSQAGPFGTRMGQPKEDFKDLILAGKKGGEEIYTTKLLPKMHSQFNEYILVFGDEGLARIIGESRVFKNDRSATSARTAYSELKQQLTEKYGAPKSESPRRERRSFI